jgi:murein DD-endopeptidase MepM/ murein hydrolase activator NlpD
MNGADFGDGLNAGFNAGVTGAWIGGAVGGILSGLDAIENNASFWDGTVKEAGGDFGSNGRFLDEQIAAGAKPTETGEISSRPENPEYGKYGMVRNGGTRPHFGVDFSGKEGDNVFAMYDGKVIQIGGSKSYGPNFVRTSSTINGKVYNVDYGHMSKALVTMNKPISAGSLIGKIGRMGIPAGMPTHVHIAVWRPIMGGRQGFVMPWWK